jgi:hypothetical protein
MKHLVRSSLIFLMLLSVGCGIAGAKFRVAANTATIPISFSDGLIGRQGDVVVLGESLEEVHSFTFELKPISVMYGTTASEVELSDAINEVVSKHEGDGIVQLAIRSENCPQNAVPFVTMLPFYPGCMKLIVSGVVVREVKK